MATTLIDMNKMLFSPKISSIKKSDQDLEILEEKIKLLWTWGFHLQFNLMLNWNTKRFVREQPKFKGHFAFLPKYVLVFRSL